MRWVLSFVAASVLLAGGCGGGSTGRRTPNAVTVIKAWSTALRHGDVNTAAAYFALPSVFADGPGPSGSPPVTIRDVADARLANQELPCGARFISAAREGRYVDALFLLTARSGPGGTTCGSGAGQTARVDFVITSGKIVAWIRAPDGSVPSAPSPGPTGPGGGPID